MAGSLTALLYYSFGGPDKPEDVEPFLDNVLQGKNVPKHRRDEVVQQYLQKGGVSPINAENKKVIAALEQEFLIRNWNVPIYYGNRNWTPFLSDALKDIKRDGHKNIGVYISSAFSSYSGCRQYREVLERHIEENYMNIHTTKLRGFYNHPKFIESLSNKACELMNSKGKHLISVPWIFTAHSLPLAMAAHCDYVEQLEAVIVWLQRKLNLEQTHLAFQSRSGPPMQPWLTPDVSDVCQTLSERGTKEVVVFPIGFLVDHMEVIYDLDTKLMRDNQERGLTTHRVRCVGADPVFISMIADLWGEAAGLTTEKPTLDHTQARPVPCAPNCCFYP